MSTIQSFDNALDFYRTPAPKRVLARLGRTFRIYRDAVREGLAAARTYSELTRRGVPHDVAVHKVFDEHYGA